MFDGKQGSNTIGYRLGRNKDRDCGKRIGRLDTPETLDQSRF